MGGWAPAGHSALTWISRSIVVVVLVATTAGRSVPVQANQAGDGLPVGVPVTYESADGSESLTLTVEEVIDPYQRGLTAHDQDRLASETKRYVGVRLTIGNDAPEPLPYFFTSHIVVDAGAALHQHRSIQRDRETAATDPRLPAGEITVGGSISGLLIYELPEATEVEQVLFTPSTDHFVTLSSRGVPPELAPAAIEEPTTTDGEAPTVVAGVLTTEIRVPYESLDGSESMFLTIEEVIDPYDDVDAWEQARLSDEGKRRVAVRLSIENANDTPIPLFLPYGLMLLDADTVLHTPGFAARGSEAQAADPDLPTGEIGAGATIKGLLFYELPQATRVEAVVFQPSSNRLLTLSSRGSSPERTGPLGEGPVMPEVETPPATQPHLADLDASGSYGSTYFGHTVDWDPASWQAVEASGQPDRDRLVLEGDVVDIEIDGLRDFEGDARRCLVEQVHGDLDELVGFDAPPDDVKPPTEDGRLPADAGLYLMTSDEDGHPREMVRYVECRTLLAGEAVLRIIITAPARYWAIDRGVAAEVLSAIESPVWSPERGTADSLSELPLPPGVEAPEVPALDCGALLTLDDADLALAAWERHRAGLDAGLLGFAGGEVCSERIASDEAMFVRIEPGHPGDFEPGAELMGTTGRGIRAFGDEALLFHATAAGPEGQSMMSVRERRGPAVLHFRLALGRPDLDRRERALLLARLAREVLPRFPGSRTKVSTAPSADGLSFTSADDGDRSHLTYVDNLLVKEEAGEWTRAEGLIATLKLLAREAAPEDVLRHAFTLDWEGTGILAMARSYLDEGTGDAEQAAEIARLLDLLTWDNEELEAMAGITPAMPATALRQASGRTVLEPPRMAAGMGVTSLGLASRQAAVRTAQGSIVDCQQFLNPETWREGSPGVGLCLEWRPANVPGPGLETGKYRIFIPAGDLPQGGWTEEHYDMALTALEHSARWYEDEGNRLARAAGAPGRMPPVNVVFAVINPPRSPADAAPARGKPCGVTLYPRMQERSVAHFQQTIAHELAHCHQYENFPGQAWAGNRDWWVEGSATWLSNVIYPTANLEWEAWDYTKGINLTTTLLDLSYGASVFFQFLEWQIGREGIFRLFAGLPVQGGKPAQERSLRSTTRNMDQLFHDFVEAMVDGSIEDSGGGRVPTPLEVGQSVIEQPGGSTQDIAPFGVAPRHLLVEDCKRAHVRIGKTAIKTSARPQVEADWLDGWAKQPTEIPVWPGDEHDRILVVTAVEASSIPFEVTEVEDVPECEPDDPFGLSKAIEEFCDLPCEPSAFFPPLSPPVDIGDS